MTYPVYPAPMEANILPADASIRASVDDMVLLAFHLQELGLYPVPKKADAKIAYWKFWMKRDGHVPLEVNNANLRTYLPKKEVDGLILAVGKSLDGRLVVLDIDPAGDHQAGQITYDAIQKTSPTPYVIATPGNGLHLYYLLPEGATRLKPTSKVHWPNLDVRAGNSLIGLPGNAVRYTDASAVRKGVADGHVGYYRYLDDPAADYKSIPVMSGELYGLLWRAQNPVVISEKIAPAHNYEKTDEAARRIAIHMQRAPEERTRLVLECLEYILKDWIDKNYDQWLQMWMAAWHGSDGSQLVKEAILSHPMVWLNRSESEKDVFSTIWDAHTPSADGYTIASLLYLARQAGWLQTTGLEIPPEIATRINVRYIQEWTEAQENLPNRVLVMSQTGSGKTYNIRHLYYRLDKPKTVIFVPTTKLAVELAHTLQNEHKMPAVLYIDQATGKTLPAEVLQAADVLVTTLQTFSNKVYNVVPMSAYGLVYFEESDQLFQQFARGGGVGIYGSHVKDKEARVGYSVIRDAFEHSGNVWCVDATMTKVTYYVADQMKGTNSLSVVVNSYIAPKADVHMLTSRGEAYQVVLQALLHDRKVVVACDTAQAAEEVTSTMEQLGVLGGDSKKKYLVITAHTERNRDVHRFMQDVNAGAQEYDYVAYNSVMASGVSITAVQPDVVVQICNYLTPRVNLQLLNRYRQQSKVYVYYEGGENLYVETDIMVLTSLYHRAGLEAQLLNMPLAERLPDAGIRARVVSMAVGDEATQRRSASQFYAALLRGDGRKVLIAEPISTSRVMESAVKEVRQILADEKEYLRHTWGDTRPIDRDDPADPDMTDMEVAQGMIHARIRNALKDNIPTDVDPEEIYDTVLDLGQNIPALVAFVQQGETLRLAETYLADQGRAITTLANHVTMIQVVTTVHLLYPHIYATLTPDILKDRAPLFMAALTAQKDNYDAVIHRQSQKWDEVMSRSDDIVEQALNFSKVLLSRIGLKQRASRLTRVSGEKAAYKYEIANADSVNAFLAWRYRDSDMTVAFDDQVIKDAIAARRNHIVMFQAMNPAQQKDVLRILNEGGGVNLQTAVEVVLMGDYNL